MSHTFKAGPLPDAAIRALFARLEQALNSAQPEYTFQTLHSTPSKKFAGMIVIVEGYDLNLGSAAGLYLRNEGNTQWDRLAVTNIPFAPGSITVPTETARLHGSTLTLGATDTVTIEGTGELTLIG